jgi:hypothetical protein
MRKPIDTYLRALKPACGHPGPISKALATTPHPPPPPPPHTTSFELLLLQTSVFRVFSLALQFTAGECVPTSNWQ